MPHDFWCKIKTYLCTRSTQILLYPMRSSRWSQIWQRSISLHSEKPPPNAWTWVLFWCIKWKSNLPRNLHYKSSNCSKHQEISCKLRCDDPKHQNIAMLERKLCIQVWEHDIIHWIIGCIHIQNFPPRLICFSINRGHFWSIRTHNNTPKPC